jgi:alpha-tubulin suppressor-like RCC1 family protein
VAALVLAGCGETATQPEPRPPVERVPTTIELSTDELRFSFVGATDGLTARILDQDGEPLAGEEVSWSVGNEEVATVDAGGVVTAVSEGVTEVVATSGSLSASANVDVRTGWIAVETGASHACGLWGHGVPFCWGDNAFGQLGLGAEGGAGSTVPARVETELLFRDLGLGDAHSCGLTGDGEVFCWGRNVVGQLGTGDVSDRDIPTPVETEERFAQLTSGAFHSCGVRDDGEAFCWGGGGSSEDGRDLAMGFEPPDACSPPDPFFSGRCSLTPRPVQGGLTWSRVSAGLFHSCGITTDGRGWCWGWNRGQLGNGEYHPGDPGGTPQGYVEPVLVDGALTLADISAGNAHSCGVTTTGEAWCWGEGDFQTGALGSGDVIPALVPARVDAPGVFVSVDAAAMNGSDNQFSCGLDTDARAWCWGSNRRGQLGSTSFDSCAVEAGQVPCTVSPGLVDTDLAFRMLVPGLEFVCGLDDAEGTWCWGSNARGQLGDGGGVDRTAPVRVTDPPPIEDPGAVVVSSP